MDPKEFVTMREMVAGIFAAVGLAGSAGAFVLSQHSINPHKDAITRSEFREFVEVFRLESEARSKLEVELVKALTRNPSSLGRDHGD